MLLYPQRSPLTGVFMFIWVARSAKPISKKLQPCSERWPFMDVGFNAPFFRRRLRIVVLLLAVIGGPLVMIVLQQRSILYRRWDGNLRQISGLDRPRYSTPPPKKLLGTFSSYLIRASTAVYCSIPKFPRILLVTSNLAFRFLHSFFWGTCVNILRRDGRAPSHFDWHRHVSGYIEENWQLGRRKRWLVRGIIPELNSVFLFPLIWE